ncbi:K(+)/H(+) antiporter 1 [Mycena sanguinolenta]|uniref:K(+)/H(+) antiporter 1 n=1 Tax=Mycena sanguinolenta TaxID=230812 RepID=A0A8H7CGQ6_9AGAR|nr:K(+)/H(+) antiporter 1 [Mycena sanguinolenta]
MGVLADQVLDVRNAVVARAAAEQAGVISGANPVTVDLTDPFKLWVIQVVIILAMVQFLSLGLSRIRQPRVISEVIGGVLLGPSVLGRIPHYYNKIWPTGGMAFLTLTSTIGLTFGSSSVTYGHPRPFLLAGLAVPLGMGAAVGVGVYREFVNPSVNFGYFLLFTAVAIGITAFPVLCRILTELKLLDTTVGVVTLSAGVGNDVVGWILLALTVALVNASTGLAALYVLLACAGYMIFLFYPVRMAYMWLVRRTGSLEQGSPTPLTMTLTLIMIMASAFFTDIIGVHPIFGGFLAGLIIPHENGYAISLVEKLEDLVTILLLPIYFTLSGLKTNLGLLNTGVTWGYIFIICLVAFSSKFLACGTTAFLTGYNWREAGAIGSLMSCKGLVELIVLNIGLSAGILDSRTFSMFVLHAIILTCMTTPLTIFFYPPKHQKQQGGTNTAKIDVELGPRPSASEDEIKTKFSMVLDKIEQLPAAMALAQLLQPPALSPPSYASSVDEKGLDTPHIHTPWHSRTKIDALRLIELTNRASGVLKSKEADSLLHNDAIVSVFRTFGYLNRILVSAALSVVSYDDFPDVIAVHAAESESQMVILPWSRGATSVLDEPEEPRRAAGIRNPFDGIFHKTTTQDQTSSVVYSEFIRKVFLRSTTDVALFVDRGLNLQYSGSTDQHLFLPFIGGPDDRLALSFLVQLCANAGVHATVIRIRKIENSTIIVNDTAAANNTVITMAGPDTVYGQHNTQTQLVSDTADHILWDRLTVPSSSRKEFVAEALSRITFSTQDAEEPLHRIVELVDIESRKAAGKNLVVMLGRSRRMAVESHKKELQRLIANKGTPIGSSVSKTLGDVGAALVASGSSPSLLVLQAAISS